jgi:hypothetical protein
VESTKGGATIQYQVSHGIGESPFLLEPSKPVTKKEKSGTRIFVRTAGHVGLSDDVIMAEIGMRFLSDPSFTCIVNGRKVEFSHIPQQNYFEENLETETGVKATVTVIDTGDADKTTKQHGIAWHVNGRLVGTANWKDYGFDQIIDGRSAEAKRYTFIVECPSLSDSVEPDWTAFENTSKFQEVREAVFEFVKNHILGLTKQKREATLQKVKESNSGEIRNLTKFRRERWEEFVSNVQIECPSLTENELTKLARVLANMEQSTSKYELIGGLHDLNASQIDDLTSVLKDWSIDLAKEVLDELQLRLKLLEELKIRVDQRETREVQDLQPIFHQALWIFGPEYETIEFTSNQGMTTVIQRLYKSEAKGSKNRPDFAIVPDGTVGSYSYPSYDDYGAEVGVERLVIVELKKPEVEVGNDEISQCWKYVKELIAKGVITNSTKVTCFVLGSKIDPLEAGGRSQGNCLIRPLHYSTVVERAKSRLLKLYDRVNGAPFLDDVRGRLGEQSALELNDA